MSTDVYMRHRASVCWWSRGLYHVIVLLYILYIICTNIVLWIKCLMKSVVFEFFFSIFFSLIWHEWLKKTLQNNNLIHIHYMMTSPNGNISRVTGLCEENPSVTGGFPSQRTVTRSFDGFFQLHLNKWLSKQSRRRWFETPLCLLWRHSNKLIGDEPNGRYVQMYFLKEHFWISN